MAANKVTPHFFEINKDFVLPIEAKYVTMIVTGTWSVSIDNLIFLPGEPFKEFVEGNDILNCSYNIQFLENMEQDSSISGDKRLKRGKFLYVRMGKRLMS